MAKYKLGERNGADIFQALCSWPEEVVKIGKWSRGIGKRSWCWFGEFGFAL